MAILSDGQIETYQDKYVYVVDICISLSSCSKNVV